MSEGLEVVETCPLGSECQEIKDGAIHRCAWYVELNNNADPKKPFKESKCAIAWQPELLTQLTGSQMLTTQAVQSMRNETIKRQDAALEKMSSTPIRIVNQES